MNEVTAAELPAALTAVFGRPETGWTLVRLVEEGLPAALIDSARELMRHCATAPQDVTAVRELADLLVRQAQLRPAFAERLGGWVRDTLGGRTSDRHDHVANSIGASATVDGPVVQARDISGGVHFHPALPQTAGETPVVPRQLPPVPGHFINRHDELARLDHLADTWRDSPVVAVVSGPAGVGKTTLARRWLLARAGSFPDGQLYADLRGHSSEGPARPGDVLGNLLRSLGRTEVPTELDERAAMWRSLTADARIALLLDNALSAAQVRPLLPGSVGAVTAVTSRNRLSGLGLEGAAFVPLNVLATRDAVELLSRRLGAERVRREPEAARAMARACANLPLAVCVAGARLATRPRQPLAAMARALSDGAGNRPLDALRVGRESAVRAALQESYRLLAREPAAAYRRLSLLPFTVFSPPVAAAVCGTDPEEADRLLDELAEANLVEDLGPDPRTGLDRYRFHDLLRAHARECAGEAETETAVSDALRRVVDFHLSSATAAEALLTPGHRTLGRDYTGPPVPPPFADPSGALHWLDAERDHLMAVLRTAADRGWHRSAWQLADAMWPLFLRLRPYELWIEAHEIGLAAALRSGDRDGISRMLTSGGAGLRNVGRLEEALSWFRQARELAREEMPHHSAGEALTVARRNEAQALHGLGQTYRLAGRLAEARSHFTAALALREEIGYRRGAALTRLSLGDTALADGRPDEAVRQLERARAELSDVDDPYDAARALALLGRALAGRDGTRHEAADRVLLQALAEFEEAGSVHWQGHVLEMLGEAAEGRGDIERARDWYTRSLARYRPVSDRDRDRLESRMRALD
ncbi:ATP-binding protein [Streptomyces sp. 351MFTsu5.1]|uniref:ATP-binding protein n=1 Tax=Streptomyces sp. 351MFTsu5.1 TaxID=1172180 RepID=UPI0003A71EE7|nr:tetratricopeptide repeat protein [Streptomyces sp. 351MFTsu5.1]